MATYAAAKGAKLYMLCRSKERAEKARQEIIEATSNDKVEVLLADMAELSQVRNLVADLQKKEPKVDVLVCNAGALFNDRRESSEGREVTFASHLLGGSYLLSQLLVPQLKAADDGRVVFVSSGGMYNGKFPSWDIATNASKEKYDGQFAYVYAKRGQVLLAEELTKTIPEITWVSAHPGWCSTPAVAEAYGDSAKYLQPMRNAWQGAEGITWLMAADKSKLQGGEFYLDRKPQPKHLAGAFMTEGSFTKNKPKEIEKMMADLKSAAGL
jgi:dehydrogenase/reductase SDR family protein 12